jgi:predicted DNA-binding ribbon-helix-helix protein
MAIISKRSVVIGGRKTSVSLEDPFWQALGKVARAKHTSVAELIREIEATRPDGSNLSSAIRVSVLDYFLAELEAVSPSRDPKDSPLDRIRRAAK